jgi:indolepyruvate ferredoxin oxidoreductase beta subunit
MSNVAAQLVSTSSVNMTTKTINIAILAMGGEGGGVLADWLVSVAEHHGFPAQSTSVPGVAQRTGATIYYVEIFPALVSAGAVQPVMSQMPVQGDVDLVIASELMEMGRAIKRGFVTPDLTTLVASTNRVYSIQEKSALVDGRVEADPFFEQAHKAAKQCITADFSALAEKNGSVISATLFGAVAGSGALPFTKEDFEAAIQRAGVGVEASLKAFNAGYSAAHLLHSNSSNIKTLKAPPSLLPFIQRLDAEIEAQLPESLHLIVQSAVRRLLDYQNEAYVGLYMQRLRDILALKLSTNSQDYQALIVTAARNLALAMTYEDTSRVAELKVRGSRFKRVMGEVNPKANELVHIHEYLHPRLEELLDVLPHGLSHWILHTPWLKRFLAARMNKARIVKTSSISGFLTLYFTAKLRTLRLRSHRYQNENQVIESWLGFIQSMAVSHPAFALEMAECIRLRKGYGDTHARGDMQYALILKLMPSLQQEANGLSKLQALRKAALQDEEGKAFDLMLKQLKLV